MAKVNVTICMDEDLKQDFAEFCDDMGMSMETAFIVFAKKAIREYRIPFEIGGNVPNAETLEAFQETERMEVDPTLGKAYTDVDQMFEELLADDV